MEEAPILRTSQQQQQQTQKTSTSLLMSSQKQQHQQQQQQTTGDLMSAVHEAARNLFHLKTKDLTQLEQREKMLEGLQCKGKEVQAVQRSLTEADAHVDAKLESLVECSSLREATLREKEATTAALARCRAACIDLQSAARNVTGLCCSALIAPSSCAAGGSSTTNQDAASNSNINKREHQQQNAAKKSNIIGELESRLQSCSLICGGRTAAQFRAEAAEARRLLVEVEALTAQMHKTGEPLDSNNSNNAAAGIIKSKVLSALKVNNVNNVNNHNSANKPQNQADTPASVSDTDLAQLRSRIGNIVAVLEMQQQQQQHNNNNSSATDAATVSASPILFAADVTSANLQQLRAAATTIDELIFLKKQIAAEQSDLGVIMRKTSETTEPGHAASKQRLLTAETAVAATTTEITAATAQLEAAQHEADHHRTAIAEEQSAIARLVEQRRQNDEAHEKVKSRSLSTEVDNAQDGTLRDLFRSIAQMTQRERELSVMLEHDDAWANNSHNNEKNQNKEPDQQQQQQRDSADGQDANQSLHHHRHHPPLSLTALTLLAEKSNTSHFLCQQSEADAAEAATKLEKAVDAIINISDIDTAESVITALGAFACDTSNNNNNNNKDNKLLNDDDNAAASADDGVTNGDAVSTGIHSDGATHNQGPQQQQQQRVKHLAVELAQQYAAVIESKIIAPAEAALRARIESLKEEINNF